MARTKTDGNGSLATLGWTAALALVVIGGIAIASALLAPGLVLAAAFPAAGTGAHPWIVDGGPEVTRGLSWRIELMLEYLAAGAVAMFAMLRFGHTLLAKLQDWYEGQPAVPARPVAQPVPMAVMPRPGHGRGRTPANDRKRDLRAA